EVGKHSNTEAETVAVAIEWIDAATNSAGSVAVDKNRGAAHGTLEGKTLCVHDVRHALAVPQNSALAVAEAVDRAEVEGQTDLLTAVADSAAAVCQGRSS